MNNVKVRVSLNETPGRRAHSRTHVGEKETSVRLCTNIISDRSEKSTVMFVECRVIRIACVEVVASVLGLQKRKETSTPKILSIRRRASITISIDHSANDGSSPKWWGLFPDELMSTTRRRVPNVSSSKL